MGEAKIFGIGFHKTGLTSLGEAFEILGYVTCHRAGPVRKALGQEKMMELLYANELEPIFTCAEEFEAFHDNPWFNLYMQLDEKFPNSKFILTIRDEDSWIKSRVNYFGTTEIPFRKWVYGEEFGKPVGNEEKYLEIYRQHNSEVKKHFASRRNKLLVVNWEIGDGWEQLCTFLNQPIPQEPFPHLNKNRKHLGATMKLKHWVKSLLK